MYTEKIQKIVDWFEDHEDVFNDCIEELDGYNGWLNDNRYYCMDDLGELLYGKDPIDLLNMAFNGYDEDTNGAFNPNRDFFRFNGYGNLVSADWKSYSEYLDDWTINAMNENRADVYSIDDNDELKALFDELDNDKESA